MSRSWQTNRANMSAVFTLILEMEREIELSTVCDARYFILIFLTLTSPFCRSFPRPLWMHEIILRASELGLSGSLQPPLIILMSHFMAFMTGSWNLCSCFINPSLEKKKQLRNSSVACADRWDLFSPKYEYIWIKSDFEKCSYGGFPVL